MKGQSIRMKEDFVKLGFQEVKREKTKREKNLIKKEVFIILFNDQMKKTDKLMKKLGKEIKLLNKKDQIFCKLAKINMIKI